MDVILLSITGGLGRSRVSCLLITASTTWDGNRQKYEVLHKGTSTSRSRPPPTRKTQQFPPIAEYRCVQQPVQHGTRLRVPTCPVIHFHYFILIGGSITRGILLRVKVLGTQFADNPSPILDHVNDSGYVKVCRTCGTE